MTNERLKNYIEQSIAVLQQLGDSRTTTSPHASINCLLENNKIYITFDNQLCDTNHDGDPLVTIYQSNKIKETTFKVEREVDRKSFNKLTASIDDKELVSQLDWTSIKFSIPGQLRVKTIDYRHWYGILQLVIEVMESNQETDEFKKVKSCNKPNKDLYNLLDQYHKMLDDGNCSSITDLLEKYRQQSKKYGDYYNPWIWWNSEKYATNKDVPNLDANKTIKPTNKTGENTFDTLYDDMYGDLEKTFDKLFGTK